MCTLLCNGCLFCCYPSTYFNRFKRSCPEGCNGPFRWYSRDCSCKRVFGDEINTKPFCSNAGEFDSEPYCSNGSISGRSDHCYQYKFWGCCSTITRSWVMYSCLSCLWGWLSSIVTVSGSLRVTKYSRPISVVPSFAPTFSLPHSAIGSITMIDLLCCFPNRDHPIWINQEFCLDLRWWHQLLSSWSGVGFWLYYGMSTLTDLEVT